MFHVKHITQIVSWFTKGALSMAELDRVKEIITKRIKLYESLEHEYNVDCKCERCGRIEVLKEIELECL